MQKNKKNEEIQSRRQFFKSAAKGALPILGAIVLANVPGNTNASQESPMGCSRSCTNTCSAQCRSYCKVGCDNSCNYHCTRTCGSTCKGGSYGK